MDFAAWYIPTESLGSKWNQGQARINSVQLRFVIDV